MPMITAPPYTIISTILDLAERIGETIGRVEETAARANLRLRRINRIRTIQGSLAIEGNTLTEEQVSTILEGKPVVAPLREIQEVRNAIKAYEQFTKWNPASETDLLNAQGILMTGLLNAPGHYRRGGVAVTGAGAVQHIGPCQTNLEMSPFPHSCNVPFLLDRDATTTTSSAERA